MEVGLTEDELDLMDEEGPTTTVVVLVEAGFVDEDALAVAVAVWAVVGLPEDELLFNTEDELLATTVEVFVNAGTADVVLGLRDDVD